MKDSRYFLQTQLLIQTLPYVAEESHFALKGGTAINLFLRDLPRLSVDIDLTYLPVVSREETFNHISDMLSSIGKKIRSKIPGSAVQEMKPFGGQYVAKLSVHRFQAKIIIEPNFTLRGYVYPPKIRALSEKTEALFQQAVLTQVMSFEDIYAGKICAALDRQHPRDLFDIKVLMDNEGLTDKLRKAFIVYLMSSDRPMHELLNPNRIDIQSAFNEEFKTMSHEQVQYNTLIETRERLIEDIQHSLTNQEKQFLISVKMGEPDWAMLNLPGIERLPGVKWKLINIRKMDVKKREQQLRLLEKLLF